MWGGGAENHGRLQILSRRTSMEKGEGPRDAEGQGMYLITVDYLLY